MLKSKNAQKCPDGNTKHQGNSRSRLYCFTSFLKDPPFFDKEKVKYLAYSQEICPTTNRPHWQSFAYFYDKVSIKLAQKILRINNSHMEVCRGSLQENEIYCSKEADLITFGSKPSQGKRIDLDEIKDQIISNNITVNDIILDNPIAYHQYGRTLHKIQDIANRKLYRKEMTKCIWYYGKTGVGKSKRAFENYNPDTHFIYNFNDNGFWNGYDGHTVVIMNEFRGQILYSELLDLIDWTPKTVKIKGESPVPFLAQKIIITSSMRPEDIYINLNEKDSLAQLFRRIELIEVVREPKKITEIIDFEVLP